MEFALLASSLMMRITGNKSSGRRGTLVTMLRSSSLPPTVDHKWTQHCFLTQVIITVKVSGGDMAMPCPEDNFPYPTVPTTQVVMCPISGACVPRALSIPQVTETRLSGCGGQLSIFLLHDPAKVGSLG